MGQAAGHEAVMRVVGGFSDQRDVQRFLPPAHVVPDPAIWLGSSDAEPAEEIWVDYVADTGDGFHTSATVAYALAQKTLPVEHHTLERGRVLVHGGDAVYPVANAEAYEKRFIGPMRAMLDHTCKDHPLLLAIPGNHDWTDGLNAWSKIMTQKGWIGGWKTAQERSYFATRLSTRWWVLGIDTHVGEYLDQGQIEFFTELAEDFEPGTQVILCVPAPTWIHQAARAQAHQVVDFLIRKALRGHADVRLILTGDLHHYSHYAPSGQASSKPDSLEPHLLTAGGGGAFLSASHWLPEKIELPCAESQDPGKSPAVAYDRVITYPSAQESKATGRWFGIIPLLNGALPVVPGLLYLWLGFHMLGANPTGSWFRVAPTGLARAGTLVGLFTLFAVCVAATGNRKRKNLVVAGGHLALHVVLLVGLTTLWRQVSATVDDSRLVGALAIAAGGAALGTLAISFALFVGDRLGFGHLFLASGVRSTKYRNFVRMKIDTDERLTVYPIGIDDTVTSWEPNTTKTGSWFEPKHGLHPRLIENPIVFESPPAGTTATESQG